MLLLRLLLLGYHFPMLMKLDFSRLYYTIIQGRPSPKANDAYYIIPYFHNFFYTFTLPISEKFKSYNSRCCVTFTRFEMFIKPTYLGIRMLYVSSLFLVSFCA